MSSKGEESINPHELQLRRVANYWLKAGVMTRERADKAVERSPANIKSDESHSRISEDFPARDLTPEEMAYHDELWKKVEAAVRACKPDYSMHESIEARLKIANDSH